MTTTLSEPYAPDFTKLGELLHLSDQGTADVGIHGFDPADLARLIAEGKLEELKRATIDSRPSPYLIGKVTVGRFAFTLFSDDIPADGDNG